MGRRGRRFGRSVVTSPTGELQLVVAVDNYTGAAEMRDLTVANIHTYYVLAGTAPVLVHNNNNDCEVDVYHAVPDDSVADSVLAGIDWERLNPNSRFGRALYVASRPETAVAEVRHHKGNPGTLMHFKLDLSLAKILDLTNPDMADSLGYRWSGKITEHTHGSAR